LFLIHQNKGPLQESKNPCYSLKTIAKLKINNKNATKDHGIKYKMANQHS
jgi:hypothetical protein